jgi:CRP/FNR family transcriptional regulator, cyclic AMP receptor protein
MKKTKKPLIDVEVFLMSAGASRKVVGYPKKGIIFSQGNTSEDVMYIQEGGVKLSVVNEVGREAVVAILGPGDFFGEVCLSGQKTRLTTAAALTLTKVLAIEKPEMIRVLHAERAFADLFIKYMLLRNMRIEGDLVDQLFNSTEKRLARTLLILAHYGKKGAPEKQIPHVSQETLAEMIGTTRSRVNLFMKKFEKLGYVHKDGGLRINSSLLSVVLHE